MNQREIATEEEKELRDEMLACPYCNPNSSFGGSPEYFDQWRIKHHFHPALISTKIQTY